MIVNNNSVEQINVALLDIDKKLKTTSVTSSQIDQIQKQLDNVQRTLRETSIGLSSGATYNISITGNASSASFATEAGTAKVTATAQSAEVANHAITADSATNAANATNATNATNAVSATHAVSADNGVPAYSINDAGKNLAVNSSGNAVEWVKPQKIKFVDYKTGGLTFSSLTDQKVVELSNFGPEVTENNVLSFMVIYWNTVQIIASGDYAKSQGTGSSGLRCVLHALNNGTGWCVIRCVYLA